VRRVPPDIICHRAHFAFPSLVAPCPPPPRDDDDDDGTAMKSMMNRHAGQVQEQLPGMPRGHVLLAPTPPGPPVRARHARQLLPQPRRIRQAVPDMQEDDTEPRFHEVGVGREGARHNHAAHARRLGEGGRRDLQRLRGEERRYGLALPWRPVPVVHELQHRRGEGGLPPRWRWGRGRLGGRDPEPRRRRRQRRRPKFRTYTIQF